jgi:hypothetical protein
VELNLGVELKNLERSGPPLSLAGRGKRWFFSLLFSSLHAFLPQFTHDTCTSILNQAQATFCPCQQPARATEIDAN